jgi:hypothetical protein
MNGPRRDGGRSRPRSIAGLLVVVLIGVAVAGNDQRDDSSAVRSSQSRERVRSTTTTTEAPTTTTTTLAVAVVLAEINTKVNEVCPSVADGTTAAADAANDLMRTNGWRWGTLANAPDLAVSIGICAQRITDVGSDDLPGPV